MSNRNLCLYGVLVVLVFLAWCGTDGKDVYVTSWSSCRKYDLEDFSEINIIYQGGHLVDNCKIKIEADKKYSKICIEAKKLDLDGCPVEFEVYAGLVMSVEDKSYSCYSSRYGSEYCTYQNSLTVIIKQKSSSSAYAKLRVYPKKSDYDIDLTGIAETAVIGVYVIVGIVIGAIVLLVVIVIIVICCCCKRREGRGGHVYRGQQPAPQAAQGTYPQVQYSTVSPQAAGYQPPPPQGYQHPPQGYQPPTQGYQPQAGYPPPPQGYPPMQGYQMAETQKMPSAPPSDKDPMAPPPYPGQ